MNQDDIVYIVLLIASIGFSQYYRKYDPRQRKLLGFVVGIVISAIVSKYHTVHLICSVVLNTCIILYTNRRICHIISFFVMFAYLLFIRMFIKVCKFLLDYMLSIFNFNQHCFCMFLNEKKNSFYLFFFLLIGLRSL